MKSDIKIIVDAEVTDNLKKQVNILTETISRRATALAKRDEIKEQLSTIQATQAEIEKNSKLTADNLSESLMSGADVTTIQPTNAREQLAQLQQQIDTLGDVDRRLRDVILRLPDLDLCQWNVDCARATFLKCAARETLKKQQGEVLEPACLLAYATSGTAVEECLSDCFGAEAVQIAQQSIKHSLVEALSVREFF